MEYAIAVIDIGMTNKKVAIYDDALRHLDTRYLVFEPVIINGLPCHDLDAMEEYFTAEIKALAEKYPVKAISVSTHGATFVCVGENGKAAVPCVYYTHEPGDVFHERFYQTFGQKTELQARTGTPAFRALINPAKGIFFAQEQFADRFKNVTLVLPYPQYWGYRFTGKTGIESTYMGNHTYLWDQIENRFSEVARNLGIAEKLPPASESGGLHKSWDVLGTISGEFAANTNLPKDTIVTMGIHDSNSSLLPHFVKKGERGFILNSTGTWCVIMNPVEKYGFSGDELGKVVFFNISAFGTPIKTAIFLGGMEFETWSELIQKQHGRSDNPPWNEQLYRRILNERRAFLLPELTQGSGQFPSSKARVSIDGKNYFYSKTCGTFADYETSFALLRVSLVMQTLTALDRAGIQNGFDICTEGGFRKDESYSRLLSSYYPENKVFLTDINEASALGAAMIAKMALGRKSLHDLAQDFEINYIEQQKGNFPEMEAYRQAWLKEAWLGKKL